MIVYAGKQFWNNFNNGDEALFQDANRPRDNDKFKIRPWLQSNKWKQREVNKDITVEAAQLSARWETTVWAASDFPNGWFIPSLQQQVKKWNPWCIINDDGNIEIVEDGTYILQASCQFQHNTSTPSANIVETVYLLRLIDWEWKEITTNQWRACKKNDLQVATFVGWYKKGAVFNVCAGHNNNTQIYLFAVMNVQRLA